MNLVEKVYKSPMVYKINVPLPNNPLQNLNCYVICDNGETLIIDTGFNRPECKEALLAGLKELNVDWEKTNMLLTHLHADHSGFAAEIMHDKPGKVYMSKIDADFLHWILHGNRWEENDKLYLKEGFSAEQLDFLREQNPARSYGEEHTFEATIVEDGDTIQVGNYDFTAVLVPGHTPGQLCLYCEREKLMFTADHVLFDITPNITFWMGVADSLGDYLESLVKIARFDIQTALPAHRTNGRTDVYARIREISEHHLLRLKETVDAVAQNPNAHATTIGSCLKWSMRGKTWEEFPLSQRWFAVGETIAHLDYLIQRGMVEKREQNGLQMYQLLDSAEECKQKLDTLWSNYR